VRPNLPPVPEEAHGERTKFNPLIGYQMTLGFYLNHIALLRSSEQPLDLEPAWFAALAESAGAGVILAGWTPTGGLLTERDFRLIRELVKGELWFLAPVGTDFIEMVVKLQPNGIILVGAGWNGVEPPRPLQFEADAAQIAEAIAAYKTAGIPVSALAQPELASLKTIVRCGLSGLMFDASGYGQARSDSEAQAALDKLAEACLAANKYGLSISIGPGVDYRNAEAFAALRFVETIVMGTPIIQRALMVGLERALARVIEILNHRA